ncbi:unnamed protein product [Acanthoscelides obtectus]|uniref:Major facilitator superfamily (MFS) profile domain-containing protein n=1 Tax=Acanthoscelides obtectus TaxID=200917 RepID=A0A9P0QJH0_ACAOB|nr:unnamed protein product [Acanthoscelides obtectus]CAK1686171.1 hypothetical protein AOBTE_LOCUS35824 [Acanthoscelides obtectus]
MVWIIVLATALNNFIAVPMSLNYGLVFRSSFSHLGLSATQGSVVLSMNAALGMLTGLINGPLLNRYGYRKISFLGATLMTTGLFLVSFARTWTGYILCYGFMTVSLLVFYHLPTGFVRKVTGLSRFKKIY